MVKVHGSLKSKLTKKTIIAIASVAAALVVGACVFVIYKQVSKNQSKTVSEILYIEETAAYGDIVVGVSESASASLVTSDVMVEAGMEVEEVYVSSGQFVTEGEIIAKLNLDDYEETTAEEEIEALEAELAELEIECESKLIQATSTYDKAIENGENAYTVYSLAIDEINDGYNDIVDNISDLNDEIDDIEDQIANGLTDDQGLADAKEEVADKEDEITNLTIAVATAQEEADKETADNQTALASDPSANVSTTANDSLTALEKELEQAETELETLETAVTKAQSDYDTAYANLDSQLESLEEQLDSQQTAKTKYLLTMATDKISAQETYDLTMVTYNAAQSVYDSAVEEIEEMLEQAQAAITDYEEDDDEDSTLVIDENDYLLAPFTGYIMSVTEIDSGMDNVSPLIISLADSSCAELSVSIDQEDISDVVVGMDVNVVFDAYTGYTMEAYVDSIEMTTSSGISASVSYTVVIHCEVPQETEDTIAIFQGMTATATFVLKQVEDVLVISSKCITTENGLEYVNVLRDDGTVDTLEIVTGFSDGFDVEVTSGLEEGDVVIIESAVSANAY